MEDKQTEENLIRHVGVKNEGEKSRFGKETEELEQGRWTGRMEVSASVSEVKAIATGATDYLPQDGIFKALCGIKNMCK